MEGRAWKDAEDDAVNSRAWALVNAWRLFWLRRF